MSSHNKLSININRFNKLSEYYNLILHLYRLINCFNCSYDIINNYHVKFVRNIKLINYVNGNLYKLIRCNKLMSKQIKSLHNILQNILDTRKHRIFSVAYIEYIRDKILVVLNNSKQLFYEDASNLIDCSININSLNNIKIVFADIKASIIKFTCYTNSKNSLLEIISSNNICNEVYKVLTILLENYYSL